MRTRKKTWEQKSQEIRASYQRVKDNPELAQLFYQHLFFLNPRVKDYFAKTDWPHQHKLLVHAMDHLFNFSSDPGHHHHRQIARIAQNHSKHGLNVHPHLYYYWIEAMIMTLKKLDPSWYDGLAYYLRECLFFPVSFIISCYQIDPRE